ncbi:hypothetical protein BJ170DRAFT_681931 [Xylariales sp. AK1849]|nr:hypothetical protein BJ170DRAFT_681931 [Xylariales sp. AK1849]
MAIDRQILLKLKGRADHHKASNVLYTSFWRAYKWKKTPRRIIHLSKEYSNSTKAETHREIKSFVEAIRRDAADPAINLEEELPRYMQRLDQLFFFGLLTRHVNKPGMAFEKEILVKLKVRDSFNMSAGYQTHGLWDPRKNRIEIWLKEGPPQVRDRTMDELISTLAHEMIHAYLDIFSDHNSKEYADGVEIDGGHGVMFWRMYHNVLEKLAKWIPEAYDFSYKEADAKERAK